MIPSPNIITIEYKNQMKGLDIKNKKKNANRKYFRNSFTLVVVFEKMVNIKISSNGKFQMTGCKSIEHACNCIQYVIKHIVNMDTEHVAHRIENSQEDHINIYFIPSMTNMDLSLGFLVDREKLDKYFNTHTDYFSLLETSFGYTGINIKIPIQESIEKLPIILNKYDKNTIELISSTDTTYKEYLYKTPEELSNNKKKKRYITFLVFHSGRVIISGIHQFYSNPAYQIFLDIVRKCFSDSTEYII